MAHPYGDLCTLDQRELRVELVAAAHPRLLAHGRALHPDAALDGGCVAVDGDVGVAGAELDATGHMLSLIHI